MKALGTQAANHPAMIARLTRIDVPADHALRPGPVAFAARIFHNHIAVARGAERPVQPCDLLLQALPFRIDRDWREEGYGGPQPGHGDTDLMHGFSIAGAGAAVMQPDLGDAIQRDFLEC